MAKTNCMDNGGGDLLKLSTHSFDGNAVIRFGLGYCAACDLFIINSLKRHTHNGHNRFVAKWNGLPELPFNEDKCWICQCVKSEKWKKSILRCVLRMHIAHEYQLLCITRSFPLEFNVYQSTHLIDKGRSLLQIWQTEPLECESMNLDVFSPFRRSQVASWRRHYTREDVTNWFNFYFFAVRLSSTKVNFWRFAPNVIYLHIDFRFDFVAWLQCRQRFDWFERFSSIYAEHAPK